MPPEYDSIHAQIEAERTAASPDAAQLRTFREYARGRHRSTLTVGQERILRGLLSSNLFSDNVCKRILAELRNRLRLARFEVADTNVTAYLETLWTLNQLASLAARVHWAMLRDGDHAVALGWVDGRVRLARERWWNGKTGMFIAYDDQDRVAYAVKDWHVRASELRRTIWWPDRIERYEQSGLGWRLINLPSDDVPQDGLGHPVPWMADGQPMGVPIVHFANIQVPNDGAGDDSATEPDPHYGMSELDGGVLGLQDEVNDLHRDLSAAARFAAYQMFYATGVKNAVDEEGNPVLFHVEPGAFFSDENERAAFGVLPPGSLLELERALNIKLQAVGRAANIPTHIISGDWPSGEALLRAEMPLIDKVETIGASVGPAWASVAHKATVLANTFGNAGLNTDALISAVFAPVARRDPLTLANIASAESPFVSEQQTLRTLGYSPADIDRILKERKEELSARPLVPLATNGNGVATNATN